MSEVVRLVPNEISADFRFDPDAVLEKVKGKPINRLLVIAGLDDGSYQIEGNCNTGEALFLMEKAKKALIDDEDDE